MKIEVGKTYHTHGSETFPSMTIRIVRHNVDGTYSGQCKSGLPYKYLEDGTINNYPIFVSLGYEGIAKAGALVAEAVDN